MSETREPVAWLYRPVGASPWEPWAKTATKADVDVLDLEQWTIQPLYTAPPTGEQCSAVPEQSSATLDAGEIAVLRGDVERLTHERDEARAEAERRLGDMQLLAKQIDLWKAASSCSTPEQMLSGRRFMDARIHELTRERDGWRSDAERMTAERDAAQAEVERLTVERNKAKAVEWLRANQSAQNLDMVANCKETLTSSRPTDEDIWREVFFRCVSEYITGEKRVIIADTMLAEYRKRWPR